MEHKITEYLRKRVDRKGEHLLFTRKAWAIEKAAAITDLDYPEWVNHRIATEASESQFCISGLLEGISAASQGLITNRGLAVRIDTYLSALRLAGDDAAVEARKYLDRPERQHLNGEDFGLLPSDMAFDLSMLCQSVFPIDPSMIDPQPIDDALSKVAERHEIDCKAVTEAHRRLHKID